MQCTSNRPEGENGAGKAKGRNMQKTDEKRGAERRGAATARFSLPPHIGAALPERVRGAICRFAEGLPRVEEIRMRAGRRVCLTLCGGGNAFVPATLTSDELSAVFKRLCGGSAYAFGESVNQGYMTVGDGIRVGVCGSAVVREGKICAVCDVTSLIVRLPSAPPPYCGDRICEILNLCEFSSGVLVYSPPRVGKTTLLRGVIRRLATGAAARRVAVVDTRLELGRDLSGEEMNVDILSSYPKAVGIEIAARTLGADVIICDEIGAGEAEAVCGAQNCGVPLVAAAHASSLDGLLSRDGFARLHAAHCFFAYVGLGRAGGRFTYDVVYDKEIFCRDK